MNTKKLTQISALTALSLVIFIIEAQIPLPVPVPGIKLGLANIITLTAIVKCGKKEALTVLLLRIFLGSVFTGNILSLIYSVTGGITAYFAMLIIFSVFGSVVAASVFGAVFHNIGQLAAAVILSHTIQIIYYLPALIISGIITGLITGLIAMYSLKRLRLLKSERSDRL